MATRYSGDVKISIVWNDRADVYNATVSAPGFKPYHVQVGRPAAGRLAVDSPAAYDAAAHAALSFADEDADAFGERAQYNQAGTGWHIARSRTVRSNPRRRRRNPIDPLMDKERDALQQDLAAYIHGKKLWYKGFRFNRPGELLEITSGVGFDFDDRDIGMMHKIAASHGYQMMTDGVYERRNESYISFGPRRR